MSRLLQPFWLFLATASDRQLAHAVEFLKAENRILRDRLHRQQVRLSASERNRLIRLGRPLGSAIRRLITVVSPATFFRWRRRRPKPNCRRRPGRPRNSMAVQMLVVRLARETGWGCTRIHGELRKLGIRNVSRTTVLNILRQEGVDPEPIRGPGTWTDFVRRHAATMWACDFFSTKVWTLTGRIDVFVLFFIHLGTRRVVAAGATTRPTPEWLHRQTSAVMPDLTAKGPRPRWLLRDRDAKFTPQFDASLKANGIRTVKLPPRSPNLNAVAERWVRSIRHECLDHFIIAGESHLRHLVAEYVDFYNRHRPDQGIGNRPIDPTALSPPFDDANLSRIRCDQRLGGLLRHYYHGAA